MLPGLSTPQKTWPGFATSPSASNSSSVTSVFILRGDPRDVVGFHLLLVMLARLYLIWSSWELSLVYSVCGGVDLVFEVVVGKAGDLGNQLRTIHTEVNPVLCER